MTTAFWVLIGLFILIITVIFIVLRYLKTRTEKFLGPFLGDTPEATFLKGLRDFSQKRLEENQQEQFQAFLKHEESAMQKSSIKSFYYLDRIQIDFLFSQIEGKEIHLKTVEKTKSSNKKLAARFTTAPLVGSSEGESGSQLKEVYETSEKHIVKKYSIVEEFLFTEQNITYQFEEYDRAVITEGIQFFKEQCEVLKKKFGYVISEEEQEAHIKKMHNRSAIRRIRGISNITGYVAFQLKVKLSEGSDLKDRYELIYDHPLNEFFTEETPPLQFKLICLKQNDLIKEGNTFSTGKSYSITVVGKVGGWDEENNTLEINPIAVY